MDQKLQSQMTKLWFCSRSSRRLYTTACFAKEGVFLFFKKKVNESLMKNENVKCARTFQEYSHRAFKQKQLKIVWNLEPPTYITYKDIFELFMRRRFGAFCGCCCCFPIFPFPQLHMPICLFTHKATKMQNKVSQPLAPCPQPTVSFSHTSKDTSLACKIFYL